MGRSIRNKKDYSFVVFADHRYDLVDNHGKLPEWIRQVVFSAVSQVAIATCSS